MIHSTFPHSFLFPPSLSISYITNCHILSQNVKYGTFVANVTKILTYALWGNKSGSNQLARKPHKWCRPIVHCSYGCRRLFNWFLLYCSQICLNCIRWLPACPWVKTDKEGGFNSETGRYLDYRELAGHRTALISLKYPKTGKTDNVREN